MNNSKPTRYPLDWPVEFPRTPKAEQEYARCGGSDEAMRRLNVAIQAVREALK